jgi:hypothetical protein
LSTKKIPPFEKGVIFESLPLQGDKGTLEAKQGQDGGGSFITVETTLTLTLSLREREHIG